MNDGTSFTFLELTEIQVVHKLTHDRHVTEVQGASIQIVQLGCLFMPYKSLFRPYCIYTVWASYKVFVGYQDVATRLTLTLLVSPAEHGVPRDFPILGGIGGYLRGAGPGLGQWVLHLSSASEV